jgi:hypothetical protein
MSRSLTWWERLELWFVTRYLRNRYNMSHAQWGIRRKRVLGALLDGVRSEFTEDNMSTALHFIVEEMLENSEDNQRSEKEYGKYSYTIMVGETPAEPDDSVGCRHCDAPLTDAEHDDSNGMCLACLEDAMA